MDTSSENAAPVEGTTIRRMIDRFRHASPKSREERAAIDAQARPDFWWKKTTGRTPTDSSARPHELASSDGEPSQAVDLRASFASYLGDTAPLQASSRYNVPVAAPPAEKA
jgi:hypothetical protein